MTRAKIGVSRDETGKGPEFSPAPLFTCEDVGLCQKPSLKPAVTE